MTGKVLLLGFFAFSLTSVGAQTGSPEHPLDALATDEYWTVHDALLDIDPRRPSMWHFINATQHGDVGYPTDYEIMPGATAVSNLPLEDRAQKTGGVSEHQMWVTPYNPDELYAAGVHIIGGLEGPASWTKANRFNREHGHRRLVYVEVPPCCSPGGLADHAHAVARLFDSAGQLLRQEPGAHSATSALMWPAFCTHF